MNPSFKVPMNDARVNGKPLIPTSSNTMSGLNSTEISAPRFASFASQGRSGSRQGIGRQTTPLPSGINNENACPGERRICHPKSQDHNNNFMTPTNTPPDAQCRSTSANWKSDTKTLQSTNKGRSLTKPIPLPQPLSQLPALSSSTVSPPLSPSSYPATTIPRAIHKKPRSYDLRNDFAHQAPAARAALAEFHSHRIEMHVSEGGSVSNIGAKMHWSASAQRINSSDTEIRTDSRNAHSWPMRGGQLLH